VELDLSPRRVDLIAEGFDLAIRLGSLPDSSLVVRQIASLNVGLYAAPGYLKRHGTPRSPEDLKPHSRLHLMHVNDPGNWHLSAGRRKAVVERRGALISANNMTMLRSLLRLGMGIGVMDQIMATEDLSSGTLVRVLPEWSLPPVAVSLLTPGRLIPAKTRVFIDLLTQRFSARAPPRR
jgi:DNA-binding transcriptional LysR family regulator